MIDGASSSIWSCSMPRNAPARSMLSRPVSSCSNPAPSVSSVETRPWVRISPSVGSRIPASASRSVLLPAPFGPMTASDSPWASLNDRCRIAQKWFSRAGVAAEHAGERALQGGPLRQAQVVADPEVADLDRRLDRPTGLRLDHRIASQDPRECRLGALEHVDRDEQQAKRERAARAPGPTQSGAVAAVGHRAVGVDEDGERIERQGREQARMAVLDTVERDEGPGDK